MKTRKLYRNGKLLHEYVEVIRCKDCKFSEQLKDKPMSTCAIFWQLVDIDHFCGYAEPKDK